MAGHHVLLGQIQSQAMSDAKFIFLAVAVVFFVALFVAAYVWMRRPEFGQKGGGVAREPRSDVPTVSVDAPRVTKGRSS
jgi:flagellar biosynthesis/type III secretory pathway M-ring protein FliF/YscJ